VLVLSLCYVQFIIVEMTFPGDVLPKMFILGDLYDGQELSAA
jgi:hypothetical protein